jgi:SNF2 family DNA or RNA helicase
MDYPDAGVSLPPKYEYYDVLHFSDREKQVYNYILIHARSAFDELMNRCCDFAHVLALFTYLRQASISPYLLMECAKRKKKTSASNNRLSELYNDGDLSKWCQDKKQSGLGATKIKKIVDIISKIPKGQKTLVFSVFATCLDLISDALVEDGVEKSSIYQIDGSVVGDKRNKTIEDFRNDQNARVFFLGAKVGSEGLNLTEATHVIICEPWWTPALHLQQISRAWRIGQTKPVHVHYITIRDSIEDKIIELCKQKEQLSGRYLGGIERKISENVRLDIHTLGKILGLRN